MSTPQDIGLEALRDTSGRRSPPMEGRRRCTPTTIPISYRSPPCELRAAICSRDLAKHWPDARFGAFHVATQKTRHHFSVEVYLGGLDPEAVRVELYAEAANGEEPARNAMARGRKIDGPGNGFEYDLHIRALRAAGDYTPRLVPYHPANVVPLEAHEILWQR
jgi:hypothetical protein